MDGTAGEDYSHWLTPARLVVEEGRWAESRYYETYAAAVVELCEEYGLTTVLECGCGTGWVAGALPERLVYVGLDANPLCVEAARLKYPGRAFWQGDLRTVPPLGFDLVCAFAVLKHFGLKEWPKVAASLLGAGRFGLFTMNVAERDEEDGCDYRHTWVSERTLQKTVHGTGHSLLWTRPFRDGALGWELLIATRANP